MNFMEKISGGGSGEEKKEENEQQAPTVGPLLLSSSYHHHHPHHHHQHQYQEPFFSPPRYNYNHGGENEGAWNMTVEREHMFDKVVTPSDVGKLNRLVIPKQHAERYFPLDSSTNYKGLLLNFEDRNGKLWRFQYSYWKSSQSYVMTKGWSRFVKEKKLDAGDIVSFQRGVGVTAKDRLFIDWKRRVNPSGSPHQFSSSSDLSFLFQNHNFINPFNPVIFPARRNPDFMLHTPNNNNPNIRTSSRSVYFGAQQQQFGLGFDPPAATTSTPPVHGKRLRLFGVNMDCPSELTDHTSVAGCSSPSSSFSTISYLQLKPDYGEETECDESTIAAHDFNIITKSTVSNMSLDLKM